MIRFTHDALIYQVREATPATPAQLQSDVDISPAALLNSIRGHTVTKHKEEEEEEERETCMVHVKRSNMSISISLPLSLE
jgi:hypothetical protein